MSNKSQQKCPNSNFEAQNQGKVCFGLLITLNGLLWGTDWQRVEEKEYMNNCMICLICLIVTQVHSQYHRHFSPFFLDTISSLVKSITKTHVRRFAGIRFPQLCYEFSLSLMPHCQSICPKPLLW